MSCASCKSADQEEFAAEINIHFPSLKDSNKPGIFVFPKLLICLNCGFSRFTTPTSELALLARVAPAMESSKRENARVDAYYRVAS
jgi:hypothetical protein